MQPARAREFSIAASDIVRSYIEQRFDVTATRRTTEEFLRDLLETPNASLVRHQPLLGEFLLQCDFVKFAAMSLNEQDMESLRQSARVFILATAGTEELPAGEVHDALPTPDGFGCGVAADGDAVARAARSDRRIEYSDVQSGTRGCPRQPQSNRASSMGVADSCLRFDDSRLARPQRAHSRTGHCERHRHRAGAGRSGSMQALDFKIDRERVSRIEVVKSVVSKFIDERPDDRIASLPRGAPYLVSPMTLDHDWLQQNLERVSIGAVEMARRLARQSLPVSIACA